MLHVIDEKLYSRQLYVLGADAMAAFQSSHILILGLGGLGQEIAKNVILAGINKVTLYDPSLVTLHSLSSGFYFSYETLNERKDISILQKMKGLNPYVDVNVLDCNLEIVSEEFICFLNRSIYTLIVVVNFDYDFQKRIQNHKLITCRTNGLVSQVFCDFQKFIVSDQNGEPCVNGVFNDVTDTGVLTMLDGERHNLNDDNMIKLHKNNEEEYKQYIVKTLTPFRLQLVDYDDGFIFGGSFEEIKVPIEINFKNIEEANKEPMILNDCEMSRILHNCYFLFNESFMRKPDEFVAYYKSNISSLAFKLYSEHLIKLFVYMYDIDLMPMASVIGGFVAQEVLKGCSGKFTPLIQFMYYDALECLRKECGESVETINTDECKEINYSFIKKHVENLDYNFTLESRYYSYEKMFGTEAFNSFKNASGFVVGAGAIGCEHLKNIVMSGISLNSRLFAADMDSIEQSNLNRQFLFRQKNVGEMKSIVAVNQIKLLNQDYGTNRDNFKNEIQAFVERVGPETEEIFSDRFYSNITFVANALDNIDGRKYVDGRIVLNRRPLFESGTLGTKGNTQVILPDITESYSSSNDPPEKSIPLCTLKNFPHMIEHTIEFALSEFHNSFKDKIISIKDYLNKEDNESIKTENIGENMEEIIQGIPETIDDCIRCAFDLFYLNFYVNIKKLILSFPEDHVTEQGIKFWSSPKRPPVVVEYDKVNDIHALFILSTVNLYKDAFGIEGNLGNDPSQKINEHFNKHRESIYEKAEKKVKADRTESPVLTNQDSAVLSSSNLNAFAKRILNKLSPIEFEKDNDENSHVDFIYACANIRAQNYKIKQASRFEVKGISGRIIPAIATTTAMVSGLSILEIYKYILKCHLNAFRNTYISLALPLITSSDPFAPELDEYSYKDGTKYKYNLWDKIEFDDITLQEFFNLCKDKFGYKIEMLIIDTKTVWVAFGNANTAKYEKYLNMKFSEMVDHVEGRKYIVLGVLFDSEDDMFPSIVIRLWE